MASRMVFMNGMEVRSKIITIPKNGETTHQSKSATYTSLHEGTFNVIVDDFVSSGATLKAIYDGIASLTSKQNPLVDLLLITSYVNEWHIKPLNLTKVICQRYNPD
jgi:hypoxanthine phosphoribosyltransferase